MKSIEQAPLDLLYPCNEALARGMWETARTCFENALSQGETAAALEGLGMAAWWLDDAAVTIEAREKAFLGYRHQGDLQSAARLATYLAYDYYSFRGEYAVANGWFQRAHRLLVSYDLVPEKSLLAIYEGALAISLYNDSTTALRLGKEAGKVARTLHVIDLEMMALGLEGLARVCAGDIDEGMRCLDESTTAAVSGEITDADACASACCFLINACERVRDYDRAAQWCKYLQEIAARWNYSLMFSVCRARYAGILVWLGDWVTAEATLASATNHLMTTRPAEAADGIVRLADLRRRQGRFEEAEALLTQAESYPFWIPGANLALIGRAALAMDQGDAITTANLAERFLRNLPAENRLDRTMALELLTLAQVELGALDQAERSCAELQSIAMLVPTEPLRAVASYLEGAIAFVRGNFETAYRRFEDAIDLYKQNRAPFEVARVRINLGQALLAAGKIQTARQQAQKAQEALQKLGASTEAGRAAELLRVIAAASDKPVGQTPKLANLTRREAEIIHLIAEGKSNQEIADRLVLSVRTVERHISNIYQKIGVHGSVARASATAYILQHDLPLTQKSS